MVSKICEQCGAEFEAKRSDAKFCSPKCRLRSHRKTPENKICIICGKSFPVNGKREYCSDACSEIAHALDSTHGHYKRYETYSNDDGSWED